MRAPVEETYLAAVLLLRCFEAIGQMRRAMSVLKWRGGRPPRG